MSMFRNAGFGSILPWWGDDEPESRAERVRLADKYGLKIEHVHAPFENLNSLWIDKADGDATAEVLTRCVSECSRFNIKTMVLHLTNGGNPPPVTDVGKTRVERIVECAEKHGVVLAFENVRVSRHVGYVLDAHRSPYVGLCYDSGHEHCWSPDIDWLSLYGDRVAAIHLSDNFQDADSHLIPSDGNIEWHTVMDKLARSAYEGTVTIEAEPHTSGRYGDMSVESFLDRVYQSGIRLCDMWNERTRIVTPA